MNKGNKIFLVILIPIIFVMGVYVGKVIESIKYQVPLAGCRISVLPNKGYEKVVLDFPTTRMFQNYYSARDLNFVEYYIPENINIKEYFQTFGYGGFHYFRTPENNIYQCGFYK